MYTKGLDATIELCPLNLKGAIKPVKLTLLFDVVPLHEQTDYGDTITKEDGFALENHEYFLDGVQVAYNDLEERIRTDYPHVDLEEELATLELTGLNNHYNKT